MNDKLPVELASIDPATAWKPWQPTAANPWNRRWICHLYRRAAFGATPAEIEAAQTAGVDRTIDLLMTGGPDAAERAAVLAEVGEHFEEIDELRSWLLYSALESGHPLREKLTLFWHNHFATSHAKVRSTQLMFEQNQTLRKHALGKFKPFLLDMSRDTAMLVWLDSNQNTAGAPNENYAREVMELFSLGVGNYTEKDVQESARAFTGWHHDPEVLKFDFNPALHDDGMKTVLGQTGRWNGDDIVRILTGQPACARFLVSKLYAFLISETPPPEALLKPLADRYRSSDYNTADLVRTMLSSRLFFSEHAYRKRVKWPIEFVLGAIRTLIPGRVKCNSFLEPLAKMGQVLFSPPNVKGWRCGTDWLNSATLLARNNFAGNVGLGNVSPAGTRAAATSDPSVRVQVLLNQAKNLSLNPLQPEPPPSDPPREYDAAGVLLYAEQNRPRTAEDLIARLGDLVLGQSLSQRAGVRIESFLLEGKKGLTSVLWERPQFRERLREAIHAIMCLPEYQLA